MEISNQKLGIDERAMKHLVETIYQRRIADQTASVSSVQPLH
jgi:hypothetical protein